MTQPQFLFFFNKKIFAIITLIILIASIFSIVLPNVKADQISNITTGINVNQLNTNIGTTVYLNGYDAFSTNEKVFFYTGNGSALSYTWFPTLTPNITQSTKTQTKIMSYNATAILIVSIGVNFPANSNNMGIEAWLLDTQQWTNITWINTIVLSNGLSSSRNGILNMDMTLFYTNNNYYIYISMSGDNADGYQSNWQSGLFKLTNNGISQIWVQQNKNSDITDANYDIYNGSNCQYMLKGASFWFTSATQLNTVYIIGSQGSQYFSSSNGGSYRILKINVVSPSVTFIGDYNYQYSSNSVYFIDFAYHQVGTSSYYDVLFTHPALTPNYQWDMEYLRFNDTNFVNDWQLIYSDTNMFGNLARNWGILVPTGIWGNPSIGTLLAVGNTFQVTPLYVGALAQVYGINIYINQTDTATIMYYVAPSGAYKFRNGADNCYFTTSNNVGGYLSPYGYGVQFQVDYQNNQVCGDYQTALTPATCLHVTWNINPIFSQKTLILPTTYGSYSLSQNSSYLITSTLLIQGIIQTNGSYNVFDDGLSQSSPFGRNFVNSIVVNGQINNDGSIIFPLTFSQTMINTPYYNAYQVNVTVDSYTYTFLLSFSWFFTDNSGVPLPNNYIGEQGGGNFNGSNDNGNNGNGGGTNSIFPILTNIFCNVKTDIIFVIFGVICGLLTWKFALTGLVAGIGISTFLCVMAGLLAIWAVGLCIVLDITLIVLGSGLLNKTENKGSN